MVKLVVWQALVRLVPALAEGRGTIDPNGGNGAAGGLCGIS
jgi:hypothetical protein